MADGFNYRTSKKPSLVGVEPAMPNGGYSDSYLLWLNEVFKVDSILGQYRGRIAAFDQPAIFKGVADTLGSTDWEKDNFGTLLCEAAKKGSWVAIKRGRDNDRARLDLDKVEEKGLGYVVVHEETIWLMPSEKLLRHWETVYNSGE